MQIMIGKGFKKFYVIAIFLIAILLALFFIYRFFISKTQVTYLHNEWEKKSKNGSLTIIYPFDSSLFPPEISAPTFIWKDENKEVNSWIIIISYSNNTGKFSTRVKEKKWKPNKNQWKQIKTNTLGNMAEVIILGLNHKNAKKILSGNAIRMGTSKDSVNAPVFYRDVPLPFAYARAHVDSIRWRLYNIASDEIAPVILSNLPVCANCHSFTPDGKTLAMDVDALGIKSAYLTTTFGEKTVFSPSHFNYWSDFQQGDFTYGLLSQISPDGKYAASTLKDHEIFVAKPDLEYSNFFFPIKGIIVIYDRQAKKYFSLPGANDTMFIQSNPNWSPDGKYIYFTKALAVHAETSGLIRGTAIADTAKFNAFLNSYLEGRRGLQFDIYRIPFNEGKGGKAEPLKGASNNGMSNFFPRFSPNGKWVIFTQSKNFMLLQPDSKLYIMPAEGGVPKRMKCNTKNMNSWHSWSPNGKWIVFSSKIFGPYTQLFLTHIDENGMDSPPILLENVLPSNRAANIPEFVNYPPEKPVYIKDDFSKDGNYNLYIRAFHLASRGDLDAALQTLEFAIKKDPKDAPTWAFRANLKYKKNDLAGSLADYNMAIKIDSRIYAFFMERGLLKYEMSDFKGAIADYDKALSINGKLFKVYYNRAVAKNKLGDKKGALDDYTKSIALHPIYYEAYMNRGLLKYQLGDYLGAIKDYDKSLATNSNQPLAFVERANAKDESGDFKGAMADYNKAIEIKPDFAKAFFDRGIAQYIQKNYAEALKDFNTAAMHNPVFSEIYYRRGLTYVAMGQIAEGCKDFKKSLSLGYEPARNMINKYCK